MDENINLSKLASGIYLVKVTTSKGIATEKLIVE
ncbi:MAG: T9SS type A sorting domain-containing protein [Bacteroidia bacterium]